MRLYYAQNKEDLLIKGFFPDVKKGFYIDVGANDPVLDSVTKIFYDEGWSGVNIEPIKRHYDALNTQRKRDINLQIGLSNQPGELTFREYSKGDGLSTFDASMKKLYETSNQGQPTEIYEDYTVKIKTLESVIKENKIEKIHFIKIDVEGYEYEVIDGYDWTSVRPELICIEANHINKDWRGVLKKHNYTEVFFDGINNYYLAEESIKRKDFFNYPQIVFAGNPVYYRSFLDIKEHAKAEVDHEKGELTKKLQDQEQHIAFLNMQQRDVRFLAKRLIQEINVRLNKKANSFNNSTKLTYQDDKSIERVLGSTENQDKDELLEFIHARDKENIVTKRNSFSRYLKVGFWKVAARFFGLSLRILKIFSRGKHA